MDFYSLRLLMLLTEFVFGDILLLIEGDLIENRVVNFLVGTTVIEPSSIGVFVPLFVSDVVSKVYLIHWFQWKELLVAIIRFSYIASCLYSATN